ncbi:MAG TPA: VOC family protein [Pyrinomonadaceae bacterium]|jgi:predicted enzyme related to lactoylglutathione lyase
MSITGLELLFLEVNDLEESIAFYHEQLGFELETSQATAEPPMATLRAGRLKVTLVQQLETMLRRGRGVHFFLGVTDVDAYYAELKGRGAEVTPPADEGWGGRFITLIDPDKYRYFFVTWAEAEGR